MKRLIPSILLLFLSTQIVVAQKLEFKQMTTAEMVEALIPKNHNNISVLSSEYIGGPHSIAFFTTENPHMPIQQGITISTGIAEWAAKPNTSRNSGIGVFTPGDHRLDSIAGQFTVDAAILEISFVASSDQISFEYFFASEEYPEFVRKGVNDVFAFFIEGPGYKAPHNMAFLPESGVPITVDNVNANYHPQYYIENPMWIPEGYAIPPGASKPGPLSAYFQFDGMTTLLEARANVEPFKIYKLTMLIADVGDNIYDSGVFIKANSLRSLGKICPIQPFLISEFTTRKLILGVDRIRMVEDSVVFDKMVHFDFNSYDLMPEDTLSLNELANILTRCFKSKLKLYGHTDDVGSIDYNQELSEHRAQSVANYLIDKGIDSTRIITEGKGKLFPITPEQTDVARQKNRRVEFLFYE